MNRSTEYRRAKRQSKINRKKRIIKEQGNYWNYKYEGTLSKGKIHCSCWMCRRKSYDFAKMQDIRKVMDMLDGLDDKRLRNHIYNRTRGLNSL